MKVAVFRTSSGSIPIQSPLNSRSQLTSVTLPVHGSASGGKNCVQSPRVSLHMEVSRRNIRRSLSESDIMLSETKTLTKLGSRSFSALPIVEEEERVEERSRHAGDWPAGGMGFPRGGGGRGGEGNGGDGEYRCKIGAYYQEMLKSDPTNALLLSNYGKYLHEVEGDAVRGEEYYGRAILESPTDGEVLSLYGRLIWETSQDMGRAQSYFNQALHASPQDCTVLGSYARFLWEIDDEEEEDQEIGMLKHSHISNLH